MKQRLPVYIEVAADLAGMEIAAPTPHRFGKIPSDADGLAAAVEAVAATLRQAVEPIAVAGSALNAWGTADAFV